MAGTSSNLGASRLSLGQWIATIFTVLAIVASLLGYGWYQSIIGNITTAQVDTDEWDRPANVEGVMNILLIGSDERSGENADYGEAEGERPDTMLIASINVDNETATLINLPRDLMVDLPACEAVEEYEGMSAHNGMINSAMTFGGMGCQWKTVEQVTGVHLDHFVVMDFVGFKDMIDAIGGVEMCIPEPVDDPKAHLVLDAGLQVLDGEESLGFVRSRYGQGDGSDLSRIDRQQEFMGAMLREVLDSDVMTKPVTITNFLGAVTDSITTDEDMTVDIMTSIAISMREVDLDRVQFVTAPNGQHPDDENHITLKEPEASELFEEINSGTDLTGVGDENDPSDASVDPSDITLEVLNNTAVEGLASEVEAVLLSDGYVVTDTGNPEARFPEATTIYHVPGEEEAAQLLADHIGQAQVAEAENLNQTLELVIGEDWQGVAGADGGSGTDVPVSESLDGTTAEDDGRNAC